MAPRGRPKKANAVSKLAEALDFISSAAKESDSAFSGHVLFKNKQVMAWNGTIGAGCAAEEEFNVCPQYTKLAAAIKRCGDTVSLTQLANNRLSIKSEKFGALVPCLDMASFPPYGPDAWIAPLTDALRAALDKVDILAQEVAPKVVFSAVLLQAQTVQATNGHCIFEAWHGIDLPPNCLLPKAFVTSLSKIKKPLAGFGYTPNSSVTFWFEDKSWIKTQLYPDQWPDSANDILNSPTAAIDTPANFFTACAAVAPFGNGYVKFANGQIYSDLDGDKGATYDCAVGELEASYSAEYLAFVAPHTKKIDIFTYPNKAYFYSDSFRGCIVGAG